MSIRKGSEAQLRIGNVKCLCFQLGLALVVLLSASRVWAQQATGSSIETLPQWTVPITITLNGGGQDAVKFGTKTGATNDLDNGIDMLNPPPPPNGFDAYFEIAHPFFPQLSEDYRSDQDSTIIWKFVVSATGGNTGTMGWDASAFPSGELANATLQIKREETVLANMLSQNAFDFTGDQNLQIMLNIPAPSPPQPPKGCCGQAAASVHGMAPGSQLAAETAINVVFFLLPIILLRRKKH